MNHCKNNEHTKVLDLYKGILFSSNPEFADRAERGTAKPYKQNKFHFFWGL